MPHTAHAWLEDEDRSGAATGLAAVSDPNQIITSGDNLRLSAKMPHILMMYAWTEFAAYAFNQAVISSPSIASNPIRITKGVALNYLGPGLVYDFRDNPISTISPGDNVTATGYEEDEAGVAHYLGVVLIVGDGRINSLAKRPPLTHIHRCTATATTAGSWTNLALTEQDALPAGTYDCYGARVESATAAAARFVFKELDAQPAQRPAVIPVTRSQDPVHPFSAYWGRGIKFVIPDGLPNIEILEVTGSGTVEVEMYLRKSR